MYGYTFFRHSDSGSRRTLSKLRVDWIVVRCTTKKTARFLTIISTILIGTTTQVAAQDERSMEQVFTVVYPTGVFPDDVQNVQVAVDKGGTIFLRAFNATGVPMAFNFGTAGPHVGESGAVSLSTDVKIIGERTDSYRATISGGFAPFRCFVPVKSKIQGIDFESPFDDAIAILASTGTEIVENRIHNVVPVRTRVPSGRIITFADGIDFSGFGDALHAITGKVRVRDNEIDGLGALFSNGIQFDSVGAESEITGNSIQNVNSVNTVTGAGITVIRSQRSVLVAHNLIIPGPSQGSGAPGIFIDGDHDALYTVIHNKMILDGPFGDGIDVAGGDPTGTTGTAGAVIRNNDITLHNASSSGGIVLFDLVTDNLIEENEIQGDGAIAFGITTYGFRIGTASLNRFIDNDIGHFVSSMSDVFFDTNTQYNLVMGECKSVIDLGVGNSATCEQETEKPTGQAITSASKAPIGNLPTAAAATARQSRQRQLEMFAPLPHTQPVQ